MKSGNATVFLLGALLSIQCISQQSSSDTKNLADASGQAAGQSATPAQQRIFAAKQQLQANPKKVQAYNDLAVAFLARARETADPAYLNDADAALIKGLSLDASNFQLQRTQVALMLRKHEYAQAKERATQLNHHTPDDVMTYGYLAEADIALGLYDDAERNAQWMLNLRPNNIPGLLIGAKLRTRYGDVQGAIDFLNLAFSETSPTEVEDLAWIDNQIASIQIDSGNYDAASQTLDQADKLFPHYPYTIENLARVRMSQNHATGPAVDAKLLPGAPSTGSSSNGDTHRDEDSTERSNAAREVDLARTLPAFAPIPQALLTPRPTGTEQAIKSAQSAVGQNTNDARAYTSLGAAYFQHARETGDVSDYQLAEESLSKSLDLTSTDFSADDAFRTMAEVCMGEHRFTDAVTYAHKALSLGTGDVSPFAIVGDAYADMGEYDHAHAAYDRLTPRDMVLEPRAAYARDSRLSYLKFVEGDTSGAINLMKTSVREGIEAQLPSENLAWLYFELGEYFSQAGEAALADSSYVAALNSHPGDYRALAALAKLRANNGRYEDAVVLYQSAIAVVPMPTFISELGDLYAKSGNQVDAKKQYAQVEYIGLLGHINQVLHNRDLAVFYADHDIKLPEALALAQKELDVRHDIYTWDALAWALFKNGKLTEAASASEKALRFGTQDSLLLFHAGMIAEAMTRHDQARLDFKKALKANPHFHLTYASVAQQHLTVLEVQSNSRDGVTGHAF